MAAKKLKLTAETTQEVVDGKVADRTFGHVSLDAGKGANVTVEVMYPTKPTVTYEHVVGPDGALEFSFPIIESGEVTVRAFDATEDERKSLGSATIKG